MMIPQPYYAGITTNLDRFLKDMGHSWRTSMRAKDRHTADKILQITLTAIPPRSGRVTQWLGPSYFDEVLPIIAGEQVRILSDNDNAKA